MTQWHGKFVKAGDGGNWEGRTGRGKTATCWEALGYRERLIKLSAQPSWIFSLPKPEGCRRKLVWAASTEQKWIIMQGEMEPVQAAVKETGSKVMVQSAREQRELLLAAGQLHGQKHPADYTITVLPPSETCWHKKALLTPYMYAKIFPVVGEKH